ncbi:universal stress protein [Desulfohalobium retbaense]|uniref:UspA domain protein n=1 Tax=Desulfohalobium retbaense (strain ATCC 49708 / DSM 5692 / JCM 16813 / HR100) TaxID=485915 RepID=C8X5G2_DESRD|nr:universal stress protein [Desulfohalobium retbaense]ACV69659.1 UspA domain protein [Desulfohalobium retbaense DSM 5692]
MLRNFLFPVYAKSPVNTVLAQAEFIRSFEPEKVYLLYVASGNSSRPIKRIDRIEKGMRELGLPVERLVRYGHVPSQVVTTAEATQSIICFTKKWKNPIKKAVAGSVISDVVRMSDEPIMIYKRGLSAHTGGVLHSSMYATDFKHSDKTCIQYIRHKAFKAQRLILLHVGQRAPDPETEKKRLENVYANLARLASECQNGFEKIEKREVLGLGVERKILRQAKKEEIDLLVIGKIDARGIMSRFTGSTAEAIYNRAPCSVLVIPSKR